MSYATLPVFKEFLEIPPEHTANDTLLTRVLARSRQAVDGYTQRTFAAAFDTTRYFDALRDVRGQTLYLDADLCVITAIANGDDAEIVAAQYVTEPRNAVPWFAIRLLSSSGLAWLGRANGDTENAIAITGRWGYSVSAPADVVEAQLELSKFFLDARKVDANDLNRTVIAGNATILPASWPATVREALAPYRRLV